MKSIGRFSALVLTLLLPLILGMQGCVEVDETVKQTIFIYSNDSDHTLRIVPGNDIQEVILAPLEEYALTISKYRTVASPFSGATEVTIYFDEERVVTFFLSESGISTEKAALNPLIFPTYARITDMSGDVDYAFYYAFTNNHYSLSSEIEPVIVPTGL